MFNTFNRTRFLGLGLFIILYWAERNIIFFFFNPQIHYRVKKKYRSTSSVVFRKRMS